MSTRDTLFGDKLDLLALLMAEEEGEAPAPAAGRIRPRGTDGPVPLSFAQRRLWFLDQLDPGSPLYNVPVAWRLRGALDADALERALGEVVRRHEVLRTVFAAEEGEPVQVVLPYAGLALTTLDLAALPPGERETEAERRVAAEAARPFDLAAGPLLRASLLRLAPGEHVLLLTMHHVASDGWSLGVLLDELAALYGAFAAGGPSPLSPLPVQYADYAVWQREHLRDEEMERQLAWWRERLSGAPALELPTDRPRPAAQSYRGGAELLELPPAVSAGVHALARREGATPFMVLLAAFQLLLARWSGEEDLVVGTMVAGRTEPETEGLIGFFLNMLALRTDLGGAPTFTGALGRVRETTLGAFAHQELPFERLVDELDPERDLGRSPVFQVLFALQNAGDGSLSLPGVEASPEGIALTVAKFDLSLSLGEHGDRLAGAMEYAADLFDASTVLRMAEHFRNLAAGIAAGPDRPLPDIPMLGEAERRRIVEEWNATEASFPRDLCVHQAFEAQAARTPHAVALVFRGEELSYAELDRRADRLARALRLRGVGPEARVGVCVERSAGMVVALLGVLKAGGAYVPLDPSYPRERLAHMAADSGLHVAVVRERHRALLPDGVECVAPDGTPVSPEHDAVLPSPLVGEGSGVGGVSPDNLAYVIYTSGSTGQPKGVGVTHRNALSFFAAMDGRVGGEGGTWLAVTSISFDISVLELLWTLARGFRVVVHAGSAAAPARPRRSTRPVEFSLFYFASGGSDAGADGYRLLMEGAKFADRNGFAAVWTPERHFHAFGGLYPNPSVTGAAVAAVTERVGIRAGSVVLPLHSPVRVAEEWSVVDVLSRGRVGISFASGWHADDFVLAPGSYTERKEVMLRGIETVRSLWRGDAVRLPGGTGAEVEVRTLPRPVQAELPVWVTAAGNPETFEAAGARGYNVLTHLLGQSPDELAAKVRVYRDALRRHGHDPEAGRVALMLHTFVGESEETVRATVRGPFKGYLATSVGLMQSLTRSLGRGTDFAALDPEDLDALLEHAFERYYGTSGLLGTVEHCLDVVDRLREIGVDELACLIDFGVDADATLAALERLDEVRRRACEPVPDNAEDDEPLAAQVLRHGVTHLQCTPSTLRTVLPDPDAPRALAGLRKLLLGGEALPAPLAAEALAAGVGELHNMYGPTETTVWSATHRVESADGGVPVGTPVANTRIHLVDRHGEVVPVGVAGELLIGGEGVARGYLGRPELTAERFVPDPFGREPGARLYRTGDLARRRPDGLLEVAGRADQQVKVRGHRIEPAEVEAALEAHPAVAEAAVVAREDAPGERRLVAYLAAAPGAAVPAAAELRAFLRERLPEYMVPSALVALERLPLTPNGKLDRRALPAPEAVRRDADGGYAAPRTPTEATLAAVWASVLRVERVGVHDNFFESGGDSILSIQVVSRAAQAGVRVTPRQVFQHQTVAELAAVAGTAAAAVAEQGPVTGEVPLTPIQRWMLGQALPEPWHYNQAFLFEAGERLDPRALRGALGRVLEHHDALRLRFHRGADGWRQESAPPGGAVPLTVLDLRGVPADALSAAIEAGAAALQGSLCLERGPLARVALWECGAGEPQRLMVVVHHLAVDGVSWRVLLEDLEAAYRGRALPPKTTSFRRWAERLAEHAASDALAAELPYWTDPRRAEVPPLPRDLAGPNPESGMRVATVRLAAEETRALLQEAPAAYRTRVDDLLLAALARALGAWTGSMRVLVGLEGHGREDLFEGVDLSRTVGWFTSLSPLLLETDPAAGPGAALVAAKEQLRAVPERGLGYGVLRHLHPDPAVRERLAALPAAEVLFNYLGQFDGAIGGEALFRPARERRGADRGPLGERGHLLEVTGMVLGGELRVDWLFGREVHHRDTVERVAERFAAELRALVAHCREPGAGACTPSDFPLARLSQEELDRVVLAAAGGAHREVEDVYPLSPLQEGLLFHSVEDARGDVYFEQVTLPLRGAVDAEAMEGAWQAVFDLHPALRTSFAWEEAPRPLQVVHRRLRIPFQLREGVAPEAFLREDRERGFDLRRGPLMRAALVRTGEREHLLVWSHHHLVRDGWSLPLVLGQVFAAYDALVAGRDPALPRPRPFRDYVAWLAERDMAEAEAFWRDALRGFEAPTPLPADHPAPPPADGDDPDARHAYEEAALDGGAFRALQALAGREKLTLNTLAQGAWALLLSRFSGEEDVLFGATVSGRPAELAGVERMVGFFINTLPVRVRVPPGAGVLPWLRSLQDAQAATRDWEHAPLVEVHGWSGVPRGVPLFESLLVFENYPDAGGGRGAPGGLEVGGAHAFERSSYPLTLVAGAGREMVLRLVYDTRRFERASVLGMLDRLRLLLEGIAADPRRSLADLPLLTEAERERVIREWNDTATDFPRDASVHALFEAQARRTPDAPALRYGGAVTSYVELDRAANRLAALLRARGAAPGDRVGVLLEPRAELVVAWLAALKAGCAYVPLDPAHPRERLALLLRDAGVRLAVTRDAHRPLLDGEGVAGVSVDGDAAEIAAHPADGAGAPVPAEALAYVVYTSGSTGTPKGVAVPHRAVVRLVAATDYVRLAPDDRVAQASTPVFDAATWEVWGALLAGASLVGIDRDTALDPRALARELREREVTALFLTTALFNQVAREAPGAFGGVRHLLFGGEAVDPDAVRRVLADRRPARLLHVYGPTESTTFATWHEVRELPAGAATVPIGRALANTTAYVADAAHGPVPAGVPGELLLGGEGLAWGYLGRPDLTAERFVPDPFSAEPGARLYRTGDRVRWSADGALEFLGRIDQQVKIRGFRIEPGEVEAVLRDLPDVRDAAVVVREDAPGERRLAAYLVPAAGAVGFDPGAAREALRARLPEYMVPSAWTVLDALPLTATGKTDRRALPAPEAGAAEARVAPRTPTEEAVSAVWAEVLRVASPGAHDRFFDLGGHSLLATQVISRVRDRLGVDLPIRALFEASTVAAFAARVDAARGEGAAPAPPETRRGRGVGGRQPLSFAQQRLWFLDQLEPGSPAYNVLRALRLHGPLDPAALRRALEEVVRRHDALRTTFAAVPGGAVQVVGAEARVALPVVELRALPGGAGERELLRLVEAEGRVPFDLARGPLLRALLLRPADGEWVLSLVVHHVVADGWSLGVLVRELSEAYSARVRGEAPRLPPVEVQYPEFAARQREWLEAGVAEAQLAFWRARLAGAPPLLDLPVDRPRPPAQSTRGTSVEVVLPVEVSRGLRELARASECTLFMTLLAGFQALLGRYAGEDDVCVGTPVAGRTRSDVEGTIGFFANTLVLRTDLGGDPDARELLRRVRETTLAAFENQDVPFERVVEELQPERSRAHDPVFQAMFALQNLDVGRLELEGVRVEALEQPVPAVKFDLNLALRDDGEQIVGGLEFRTDLWDVESALRMVEHLSALLAGMAADPDRPLSDLDLLDDAGRAHLLVLGDGGPPVPAEADLAGLFVAQALRTPDTEAVAAPDGALTYAELDARSAGLARRLRALGAGPETRVGVCLERGLDMAVAVLAALRAGAAYVPLDPRYPAERLAYMLRDADAQLLLTQERLLARLPEHGAEVVLVDAVGMGAVEDGPGVPADPDNLAYVVYTSGSTGTPKGVAMPRGPLGALVAWQLREWGARAPARTLQFASLSFDVSFQEMLTTWASGGTLVLLAEEERADLAAVLRRIEAERVERVFLPFVALQHLAELGDRHAVYPASLREVVTAGEQLRVTPQLARWMGRLGGCALVNQYGPSETHVVTSFALEGAPEGWSALPPIGRPVAGVRAYVLDRRVRPAPTGVPGELYLGGAPVARGYLGRPAATAERFLPDPFAAEPGARMYRTGDRVRWRADGELEFLGRVDQQVKVRGFRVEPGEVEAALERHPAVREAAVVAREDAPGDRFLAAYWSGDADAETLRGWLRGRLPEHMVPSAWTRLERLPLTPSGKTDRRSLPAPERAGDAERRVAPRTPAEEALAAIWREVLKTERVGVHDGFFELGGHSLLATQVVSRVREALGVEVPVAALFDHPTVEGLARVVEEARAAQPSPADRIVPIARQARRGVRSPSNVILK